jgi:glycosyltransferase involved in cell wall biosynthesis
VKIAEIAPPWFAVPPPGYGGVELIVAELANRLSDRHDVTLFAAPGSRTAAHLVTTALDAPDPSLLGNEWHDAHHAIAAYLQIRDGHFDVVHDHSGIVGPALGALLRGGPPVVHTLHGPWTELSRLYFSAIGDEVHLVAISQTQRDANLDLRYAGVVHNGIDIARYPCSEVKDDFLVYIGRANPDKGPAVAIEVARRAGLPLAMVVKKTEPLEQSYWDQFVAPHLNDEVEVYEDLSHEGKVDLLSRARAMVFPIQWPEPFGLVMVEAMACGTPVVACAAGAAVELVEDGTTGFLRDSVDDLVEAVAGVGTCAPAACRARVEERFSAEAMVRGYERVFERVVEDGPAPDSGFPLST